MQIMFRRAPRIFREASISMQRVAVQLPRPSAAFAQHRSIIVPASKFAAILEQEATTSSTFAGVALAALNGKLRGEVLATLTRGVMSDLAFGARITDAERGTCGDGRARGIQQAEYDWTCDGRRIECKSSQMQWCQSRKLWFFRFRNIKFDLFDELLVALFTPSRLYIYLHDLMLGVATEGRNTNVSGHSVELYSPRASERRSCWAVALVSVLEKLDAPSNACKRIFDLSLDDARVAAAIQKHTVPMVEHAYRNVPLAGLSPPKRGFVVQLLVRQLDCILHPQARIEDPVIGRCINGSRRNPHTAEYDWLRNGKRIECKHAQLQWKKKRSKWTVNFQAIKIVKDGVIHPSFDELLIVLYTPTGLHVYQHDLRFGVSSAGKATEARGCSIAVYAPAHERDWANALDAILRKIDSSDCKRVAVIPWS